MAEKAKRGNRGEIEGRGEKKKKKEIGEKE